MNSGASFYDPANATTTNTAETPSNQAYYDTEPPSQQQTVPMYTTATTRGDAAQAQSSSLEGNMAELLEAAAKATSESQRAAAAAAAAAAQYGGGGGGGLRKMARNTDLRAAAMQEEVLGAAGQKRKRTVTPEHGGGEGGGGGRAGSQSPRKRARQTPTMADGDAAHMMAGVVDNTPAQHYHHQSPSGGRGLQAQQQQPQHQQSGFPTTATDARTVGVHSAAALFRQPSASGGSPAKKHTRPPMSKLFASLQLTPENFLRLQAAAKQYMLDETHPERQSCVGSRGKGDTDMVKLRLFNCCRDFLNDGIGDRYFGPDVPAPTENEVLEGGEAVPGRKWVWPRDGNKIVSLVTPLLRRMVTNERQRQYAQETRKGMGSNKRKDGRETSQEESMQNTTSTPFPTQQDPTPDPVIDPALSMPQEQIPQPPATTATTTIPFVPPPPPPLTQYPRFLQTQPPSSIYTTAMPTTANSNNIAASFPHQHSPYHHQSPPDQNVIQILITKNNTKLLPRIDMPSWPSTPHHTLPLADLRKAVEEEVRGLLKRGLDLGVRRRRSKGGPSSVVVGGKAQVEGKGKGKEPESGGVGDGGMEEQEQGDVDMESGGEQTAIDQPGGGASNDSGTAQQQEHAEAEQQSSLEGISFEIRALTGRGLVLVAGEDEWRAVLAETGRAVWMEGVVRVVVEVI